MHLMARIAQGIKGAVATHSEDKQHTLYYDPAERDAGVYAILEGLLLIAPDRMLDWFKDSVCVEVSGHPQAPEVEMTWHGGR